MPKRKKLIHVVGARPQFIKAAALNRELRKTEEFDLKLLHTGQHSDARMSQVFFRDLELPEADIELGIHSLHPAAMCAAMLMEFHRVLPIENPDLMLVYGDTVSTLAGALAARHHQIPLVHIEAGMRSYERNMPEEINRVLSDHLSDVLLCTGAKPAENLRKEGLDTKALIEVCGDLMLDIVLRFEHHSGTFEKDSFALPSGDFYLFTLHRAANTDDRSRLERIFRSIESIHQQVPVLFPLHPRTRNKAKEWGLRPPGLVCEPLNYLQSLEALRSCTLVITDSGGLQREAAFLQKPCLIVRNTTEWTELTDAGACVLWPDEVENLADRVPLALQVKVPDLRPDFGGGKAAECMVNTLRKWIGA